VLERFKVGEGVLITRIKIDQKVIYEEKASRTGKHLPTNITVEEAFGEKRSDYDLLVEGIDSKTKQPCTISKTKYNLQPS
jgi:hypothetical protein